MSLKVKYFYFLSIVNALAALIGATRHDPLTFLGVILAVMCWFIAGDIHAEETKTKGDN